MTDYRDWRDLIGETPAATAAEVSTVDGSVAQPSSTPFAQREAKAALPPEVTALLAEQERLKAELDALTRRGPPTQEDQREAKRFPVKVHTKETRIEERRLQRHDERLSVLKRRAVQRAMLKARLEDVRAQAREAEAQQRRLAVHAQLLAREQAAEAQARALAAQLTKERWQAARDAALAAHEAQARQAVQWQARQLTLQHEQRAAALVTASLARKSEQRVEQTIADQRAEEIRRAAQRVMQARRKEARAVEQRLDDLRRKRTGEGA